MKLLDRYILRLFSSMFIMVFFILTSMLGLVKFIDEMEYFTKFHASVSSIIQYIAYYLPTSFHRIIPISVILSILLTLLILNIHNELIALQAGGISKKRVAGIILLATLGISIFLWWNNEYIYPTVTGRMKKLQTETIEKQVTPGMISHNQTWMKGAGNEFYSIELVGSGAQSLQGLIIYKLNPSQNRILSEVNIQNARWDDQKKQWIGDNIQERLFNENGLLVDILKKNNQDCQLRFEPEDFLRIVQLPNQMNTQQLREHIVLLKSAGMESKESMTLYYSRYAGFLSPLIIAIIGISFGFYMTRMEIASGFAQSILWVILYLLLAQFSVTIGKNGIMPPLVCAWAANLIAGTYGLFRLNKILS